MENIDAKLLKFIQEKNGNLMNLLYIYKKN